MNGSALTGGSSLWSEDARGRMEIVILYRFAYKFSNCCRKLYSRLCIFAKNNRPSQMEYIHKVKYYECDRMGVTHHSNYVRFMEEARIDLLDRLGYGFDRMEAEGVVSPVTEISVEYRKPTTFQDEISIEVQVIDLSSLKLKLGYVMTVAGTVVCTGRSTHCFLEAGRPVVIADRFPDLSRQLQALIG